jgi:hypothetical protein
VRRSVIPMSMEGASPGSEMQPGAADRSKRVAARNRARLNEVSEQLYLTHRGQPAERILAVMMRRATSAVYQPTEDTLRPAAKAISQGRSFTFE